MIILSSKKKFLKISFILLFSFSLLPYKTKADAFVAHLFFNAKTKTLTFDKLSSENISRDKNQFISVQEFSAAQTSGEYILKLYDFAHKEISTMQFDKKDGAFAIELPYFSLAKTLKIFQKSKGQEMLSADLSQFSTCNGNGICEFEKVEPVIQNTATKLWRP